MALALGKKRRPIRDIGLSVLSKEYSRTYQEIIFLSVILKCEIAHTEAEIIDFKDAGLRDDRIVRLSKKFRDLGYIQTERYLINEDKREELEEQVKSLENNIEKILEIQKEWLKQKSAQVLIILSILVFSIFFLWSIIYLIENTNIESLNKVAENFRYTSPVDQFLAPSNLTENSTFNLSQGYSWEVSDPIPN